jgi:hypothetical protein
MHRVFRTTKKTEGHFLWVLPLHKFVPTPRGLLTNRSSGNSPINEKSDVIVTRPGQPHSSNAPFYRSVFAILNIKAHLVKTL